MPLNGSCPICGETVDRRWENGGEIYDCPFDGPTGYGARSFSFLRVPA